MREAVLPLVSVIVPVYNVEQYLDACLESIRRQSYGSIEIIVVEDCSVDRSLSVVLNHTYDDRIKLIRHSKNRGLSAARNTGLTAARGEFVLFIDSDDLIAPDLISECIAAASSEAVDVVAYQYQSFDDGCAVPRLHHAEAGPRSKQISVVEFLALPHFAWLKFVRRNVLVENGILFPEGYFYEDWPFHWAVGLKAKQIVELPFHGVAYRQRRASITESTGRKLLDLIRVQVLVLELLGQNARRDVVAVFWQKVCLSLWSLLMRIDKPLLPEAIDSARRLRVMARKLGSQRTRGCRERVVYLILSQPRPIGHACVRAMRLLRPGARWARRIVSGGGRGSVV